MAKLLEKLLKPITKKDISQKEFNEKYSRNVFQFFAIQIINLLTLGLYMTDMKNNELHGLSMKMALSINVVYCIFVRSRFWVFRIWYTVCLTCYPHLIVDIPQGVYYAGLAILFCPLFILSTTERQLHAGISLLIGLFYFHFKLKYLIFHHFSGCLSEEEIENISLAIVFFIPIMYTLVGFYYFNHKRALKKLAEAKVIEDAYSHQNNFLLSLSHELRNPLNAIIGSIQLALLDNLSRDTKETLENAQIGGEVLLQFINNILDGGKIDAGGIEIREDSVNIVKVIQKVWSITSRLIKNKGLSGTASISKDIPKYLATDSYRMTQVLLNLISNAIKFTQSGNISVKIDWLSNHTTISDKCFEPIPFLKNEQDEGVFEKNKNIFLHDNTNYDSLPLSKPTLQRLGSRQMDSNVGVMRITISDTGCGIAEEDLPKLFKKFAQVNKEAAQRQIGTGLGLYITKEICKKMNGDLRVYSKLNEGSVFIVCLTMKVIEPPMLHAENLISPAIHPRTIATKERGLIVDDDTFNRKVLSSFFQKSGMVELTLASDGMEAYETFVREVKKNNHFKIITMDYDMPKLNGKDSAIKIREYEKAAKLTPSVIIMVSGHCIGTIIEECLDRNGRVQANYFLKKPVSFEQISDIIRRHAHEKLN